MKRRHAIMIPGWAHAAGLFEPLASALSDCCSAELVSLAELSVDGPEPGSFTSGLADRVRRHGAGGVLLIGWSMGGMVALDAAARLPQEVAALVPLSTTPRFCQDDGFEWGAEARAVRAMRIGMRRDPERVLRDFFTRAAVPHHIPPEMLDRKTEAALAMGRDCLAEGLDYLLRADVRPTLAKVSQPCLVVHGQRDEIVSWQAGEYLDHALANSHLVLAPDAGHALPEQCLSLVADQIAAFVEAQP